MKVWLRVSKISVLTKLLTPDMITLENLTRKQKVLCEVIWNLDTSEQVLNFVRSLPQKDKEQAQTLYTLMILETLDQEMDIEDLSLAKQVIDKVR